MYESVSTLFGRDANEKLTRYNRVPCPYIHWVTSHIKRFLGHCVCRRQMDNSTRIYSWEVLTQKVRLNLIICIVVLMMILVMISTI